jgi:hypothetical protein
MTVMFAQIVVSSQSITALDDRLDSYVSTNLSQGFTNHLGQLFHVIGFL